MSETSDVEQLFQGSNSIFLLGNWTFPLNICLPDDHHLSVKAVEKDVKTTL